MPNPSKPRPPAYGLYWLDAESHGLRVWPAPDREILCGVACTLPVPSAVRLYHLLDVPPCVLDDLAILCTSWGYMTVRVDRPLAIKHLTRRYDIENPWPISAGPSAGVKETQAVPRRKAKRRRRTLPRVGKDLF